MKSSRSFAASATTPALPVGGMSVDQRNGRRRRPCLRDAGAKSGLNGKRELVEAKPKSPRAADQEIFAEHPAEGPARLTNTASQRISKNG